MKNIDFFGEVLIRKFEKEFIINFCYLIWWDKLILWGVGFDWCVF